MNWTSVALFTERTKAEELERRLKQAGFTTCLTLEPPLARLWFVSKRSAHFLDVPAEQLERAERFLLDLDTQGNALSGCIRCPECHSLRVDYPQYARHSLLTNLAMGTAAELGVVQKAFYCQDCHFTWPGEGSRPQRNPAHGAPYYFIEGIRAQREQASRAENRGDSVSGKLRVAP
jgi:hypothetical protein